MELNWTQQDVQWVEDNMNQLLNAGVVTDDFRNRTYLLYNKISGTNKKPTSCGRCWRNTKRQVIQYYQKIKQ